MNVRTKNKVSLITIFLSIPVIFLNGLFDRPFSLFLGIAVFGAALNMLAIYGNGGKMPVFFPEAPWLIDETDRHKPFDSNTRYKYLCDIYRDENKIQSIGDMFVTIGGFFLFSYICISLLFSML